MSQNQSNSPSGLIAMSCVLPALSTAAVGLRFWLRGRQKSQLKIDDWLMVPALVRQPSSSVAMIRVANTSKKTDCLDFLQLLFIGMCICAILGMSGRSRKSTVRSFAARVGVRKRAWGYPDLNPNDGIEAYEICQIYEGQVSPGYHKFETPFFSYCKRSNSYKFSP